MPDVDTAADEQLLRWLDTYPPRQAASMSRLLRFSGMAAAPRGLLDRFLDRPGVPAGLANRIVSGTGDVDSAQLPQRLWALGRLVAGDPALTAAFDEGLEDIATRTSDTPLQPAVDAFLAEYGHRGSDEYELATPAWIMDPAAVYAAIDRLRHAPDHRDPAVAAARLPADADVALTEAVAILPRYQRRMARRCAMVSRQGSIARERAKDILVLENLGARRVLHELARRAAERGGPADVRLAFCVTATELADFVAHPPTSPRSSPNGLPGSATSTSASRRRGSRDTSPTRTRGRCGWTPSQTRRPPGRRSAGSRSAGARRRGRPA